MFNRAFIFIYLFIYIAKRLCLTEFSFAFTWKKFLCVNTCVVEQKLRPCGKTFFSPNDLVALIFEVYQLQPNQRERHQTGTEQIGSHRLTLSTNYLSKNNRHK